MPDSDNDLMTLREYLAEIQAERDAARRRETRNKILIFISITIGTAFSTLAVNSYAQALNPSESTPTPVNFMAASGAAIALTSLSYLAIECLQTCLNQDREEGETPSTFLDNLPPTIQSLYDNNQEHMV